MRRGDFVNIAMQGDLGKPRPALIQADPFADNATRTVLPVTSSLVLHHCCAAPGTQRPERPAKPSQVMVDRAATFKATRSGPLSDALTRHPGGAGVTLKA
jgi:mRNA interferase MazF